MSSAPSLPGILPGSPLDDATQSRVIEQFHRDGFAHIPAVLTPAEVALLRRRTDELMDDPKTDRKHHVPEGFILRNTLELDPIFTRLLIREPILGLAEAVLGKGCKFVGQNVIRNPPGTAIARWHVDDTVEFPLPDDVPRHDARARMPVQWMTIQMALSDLDTDADGPTQFVPGSHYSGRNPNNQDAPRFEGRGPVSVYCKAGDIYLQNNQCWHRGAPNTGVRTRYLTQSQFCMKWAFTRFNVYNRVPVPAAWVEAGGSRLRDVLGLGETSPATYG